MFDSFRRDLARLYGTSASHSSRIWKAPAALLIAAVVILLVPNIAWANAYGRARLTGKTFLQAHATIRYNTMSTGGSSAQFVNTDMWVDNGTYWVEAGIQVGYICIFSVTTAYCSGTSQPESTPRFFWADWRPDGGDYNSHVGPTASANTYYDDYITNRGGGTWDILVGGFEGTSVGNISTANSIRTGTEVTSTASSIKACASERNLSWTDASGTVHNDWDDAEGAAQLEQGFPPEAYWINSWNWLRSYINTSC